MALLNTDLASDIRKYGNFDFSAGYNCGHCTAVCSLTEKDANFPRMMVRYTLPGAARRNPIEQGTVVVLCLW
jgi:heterodisulfide reductase subunit C